MTSITDSNKVVAGAAAGEAGAAVLEAARVPLRELMDDRLLDMLGLAAQMKLRATSYPALWRLARNLQPYAEKGHHDLGAGVVPRGAGLHGVFTAQTEEQAREKRAKQADEEEQSQRHSAPGCAETH